MWARELPWGHRSTSAEVLARHVGVAMVLIPVGTTQRFAETERA